MKVGVIQREKSLSDTKGGRERERERVKERDRKGERVMYDGGDIMWLLVNYSQ